MGLSDRRGYGVDQLVVKGISQIGGEVDAYLCQLRGEGPPEIGTLKDQFDRHRQV